MNGFNSINYSRSITNAEARSCREAGCGCDYFYSDSNARLRDLEKGAKPPAGVTCTRASFGKMKGQLSLFPEKQNSSGKTKKKKEKREVDPSQTYDERMKRYWHYMETKGMNEQWIETSIGELRIIIEALADYYDMAGKAVEAKEVGYSKAVWETHLEKIKQIKTKLEDSTGYSRDGQLEICMKRKPRKDNDIGEDALVIATRK